MTSLKSFKHRFPNRPRRFPRALFSSNVANFLISMLVLSIVDLSLVPAHRPKFHDANIPHFSSLMSPGTEVVRISASWFWLFLAVQTVILLAFWQRTRTLKKTLAKSDARLKKVEAASHAKSLFLANTSHEIRTPLGAILGFAKLLQDPKISQQERDLFGGIIEKTGITLTNLLSDILDLSKVEAGHMQIQKSDFSLRGLLEEVQKICLAKHRNDRVSVSLKVAPGFEDLFHTDRYRLQQILTNLLSNALKFTVKGQIIIEAMSLNNEVLIKVTDTGVGIRAEDQEDLFQGFIQIENSSSQQWEGTGLGLALSRSLARNLGGDLILESSEPGKGSCFVLKLPREAVVGSAAEAPGPATATSIEKPEFEAQGERILLVDDSAINRLLIERILVQKGFTVDIATNGEEGVAQALKRHYDVVIMDMQMPVMDGRQAAARLRGLGYDRPIIALTAQAMKEDRDLCLQAGCDAYLSKPIEFDTLFSTLNAALKARKSTWRHLDISLGQN